MIIVKRVKKVAAPEAGGAWKIALADFMTALMIVFFTLWTTANKSDSDKAALADYFKGEAITADASLKLLEAAYSEITEILEFQDVVVSLDKNNKSITIQFNSSMLFTSGSADLKDTAITSLSSFTAQMQEYDFFYHIYGYTDAVPMRVGGAYRNNLELSFHRAIAAGSVLVDGGISSNRLTYHGEGVLNPVNENTTPENMASNRRVEMFITHTSVPSKVYGKHVTMIAPRELPEESGFEVVELESTEEDVDALQDEVSDATFLNTESWWPF